MAGLLDFLGLGDLGGGGGLLGNIQGGVGQFGQGVQSAFDNPLMHLGLGLASGGTASEGIKNAMMAMAAKKKDADQKAIYSAFLQNLPGLAGGGASAVAPSAIPTGLPAAAGPAPAAPSPLAPPAGAPAMPPMTSTGGGSAFGGLPGWAPGEKPIGWDAGQGAQPSPAPPAPTGAMPSAGGPPPLTGNPTSAHLNRMIAIMAHPDLSEGSRKVMELMVGKALDDNKLTNEQKNYIGYYSQTRAAGGTPVGIEKFMAMPRHAPSIQTIYDPATGQERKVSYNPMTEISTNVGGVKDVSGGAPAADMPPGSDVGEFNKRRAAATVANEEDAVKSAKAAAEFKPLIDQAVNAYQKAMNAGAIGPYVASMPGRMGGKYITQSEHEALRQDYDKALSAVQARITAAQNKGEGAVSNFERQMYAAQFPDLSAINPKGQLNNLRQIQSLTHETVGIGKTPGIGQAPVVQQGLERASTFGGAPSQAAPAITQARDAIAKGAPREAVIQRLRQNGIDPSGL